MTEKYYVVADNGYEHYNPRIVLGPEQPDWEAYCQSLMDEAVLRQIDTMKEDGWNVWPEDVIERLIEILEENGYKRVKFPSTSFFVSCINSKDRWKDNLFVSDEVAEKVVSFNQKSEEIRAAE